MRNQESLAEMWWPRDLITLATIAITVATASIDLDFADYEGLNESDGKLHDGKKQLIIFLNSRIRNNIINNYYFVVSPCGIVLFFLIYVERFFSFNECVCPHAWNY